jgi:aryl-alcohol dehydrogenase-like predicted oxidoreductase
MRFARIEGISQPASLLVLGCDTLCSKRLFVASSEELLSRNFALLDEAYSLGWNMFDTARIYPDSERTLGLWIAARGIRDRVLIITKGCHPNRVTASPRITSKALAEDVVRSLARLRTDYIDLYLLHRDDPSMPVEAIVDVLSEEQARGRVRAFGVSNWNHQRLRKAISLGSARGLRIAASSPQFSLIAWTKDPWPGGSFSISGLSGSDERAWYEKTGVPVIAWSPLARGAFKDRQVGGRRRPSAGAFLSGLVRHSYRSADNLQVIERARAMAGTKGATSAQIVLAYVLAQPFQAHPVVGCKTRAHLRLATDALDISLSDEEVRWLDGTSDKEQLAEVVSHEGGDGLVAV